MQQTKNKSHGETQNSWKSSGASVSGHYSDPMSPILFNIVVDMLKILIGRAKENDQVGGLVPHLVEGGVSIL